MTKRGVLHRWKGWRRSVDSPPNAPGPLREFVYLDETSVTSLVASKTGAVAEQFVADRSDVVRAELENALEGTVPALAKGKAAIRAASERSSGSQVTRRAVIQSTFKELRDAADSSLVLAVRDGEQSRPGEPRTFAELLSALVKGDHAGWAVNPAELKRGSLIEIEVDLYAEEQFQTRAAMDAMVEIVTANPGLFDGIDSATIGQVQGVQRMLAYLLGDLVPLQGFAVGWRLLTVSEGSWLVRTAVIESIGQEARDSTEPLSVVGVAQESLFWKDIRRVLFDGSRFSVYCRVGKDGLQTSWQPVKLLGVLERVAPSAAHSLELGVKEFLNAFQSGFADSEDLSMPSDAWDAAAKELVSRLSPPRGAENHGLDVQPQLPTRPSVGGPDEFEKGIEWLDGIMRAHHSDAALESGVVLRDRVLRAHGIIGGQLFTSAGAARDPIASVQRDAGPARNLDVEIVAIYW